MAENGGGVGDFQARSILQLARSAAKRIMSVSFELQVRGSAGTPKMASEELGCIVVFVIFENTSNIEDQ